MLSYPPVADKDHKVASLLFGAYRISKPEQCPFIDPIREFPDLISLPGWTARSKRKSWNGLVAALHVSVENLFDCLL